MKLNIGCGFIKFKGFINIDKSKNVLPDKIVDIEKGIPYPDNHFDEIFSDHCLEHIKPDKWDFVLNEIARVAKDGCILELFLPFDNLGQRTNFDHYRTFSWRSFEPLEVGNERDYYSKLRLKRIKPLPSKWLRMIYHLLPSLKYEIKFKYEVVKNE